MKLLKFSTALACFLSLGLFPHPAFAQSQGIPETIADLEIIDVSDSAPLTLKMALEAAEIRNPRIQAAQQRLEISQTDIRLARSGWLPVIEANASYGYLAQDNEFTIAPESSISGTSSNFGVSLRQPLFRGNQVKNAVKSAMSNASATEAQIATERQQIFLEVATTYLEVQRDLSILRLNLESLETLKEQLKANQKRYEYKDTSLTDVARSRSAVARTQTQIATARARYSASRAVFFGLTGLQSGSLVDVSDVPNLPMSFEEAFNRAMENNPSIASVQLRLEASHYAVKQAKGQRLPSIDFNSSVNRGRRPENFGRFSDDRTTTNFSANVSVTVPIFQADQEFGNIKRAKQIKKLREIEVTQTMANLRDNVSVIWDRLRNAKIGLSFHDDAIVSAESAAEGTRAIYRSGLVSVIDLTETERLLLETKIAREQAQHEYYVIAYTLLSAMGDIRT